MLHNSNLMYTIYPGKVERQDVMEAFFVNSLWKDHLVNQGSHEKTYLVDGRYRFLVCDASQPNHVRMEPGVIQARYNSEVGLGDKLPLWMLGFLY